MTVGSQALNSKYHPIRFYNIIMQIVSENKEPLDLKRRKFLIRGSAFLLGSLLEIMPFSNLSSEAGQKSSLTNLISVTSHLQKIPPDPCMALIIDDIGNNIPHAKQFLDLGVPLTFSILPSLPHSSYLAEKIYEFGHEIMLHLPMEPYQRNLNPGPGALYINHSSEAIAKTIKKNLLSVPLVTGVNNHMGSRFTSSENKMKEVLTILKKSGLFFIDSLTTHQSIAYKTAKHLNLESNFRNIFLDNFVDEKAILTQLNRLEMHAIKHGHAIGIGHPHPQTARAIRQFLLKPERIRAPLVYASKLFEKKRELL